MKKIIFFLLFSLLVIVILSYNSLAQNYNDWSAGGKNRSFVNEENTFFVDVTNQRVGIGTSSPSYKLHVIDSTSSSRAISSSVTGNVHALAGTTSSTSSGAGIYGYGNRGIYDSNSNATGGRFIAAGSGGTGVRGTVTATSGTVYGGYFLSSTQTGHAVKAIASATSGTPYGLYASVSSASGYAGYFTGGQGVQVSGGKVDIGCYVASASGSSTYTIVSCSSGYEHTGGGCYAVTDPYTFRISRPSGGSSRTDWQCGGNTATNNAYAICCRIT